MGMMNKRQHLSLVVTALVSWLCSNHLLHAQALQASPVIQIQKGHSSWINSVQFSPDNRYALSASFDHNLVLWDVATGKAIRTLIGHARDVSAVRFFPNGQYALSASDDESLKLWELASGKLVRTITAPEERQRTRYESLDVSSDGKYALSGGADNTLSLWDISSGNRIRVMADHPGSVTSIAFSPDGSRALAATGKGSLHLWNVQTGQEVWKQTGKASMLFVAAFSPDGKTAICGIKNGILLFDSATGETRASFGSLNDYMNAVKSAVFSPDGRLLLVGSSDDSVTLWDIASKTPLWTKQHSSDVNAVAFSCDGAQALATDRDTLRLYEVASGKELSTMRGTSSGILAVDYSPDGRHIITASEPDRVNLWDARTGKLIWSARYREKGASWAAVAFSPDGRFAVSGGEESIRLWEVASGNLLRTMTGSSRIFSKVTFSPDGKYVLSDSREKNLVLWDVTTGKELRTFSGHLGWITAVAFSADGNYVASASREDVSVQHDRSVRIWDVKTGALLRQVNHPRTAFYAVSFSPDGKYLLTSLDDTLVLLDVATGAEVRSMKGHKGHIGHAVYSPDGKHALSAGEDLTIRLWDVDSGKELRSMTGHSGDLDGIAFSRDGNFAVSGSQWDGMFKVWNLQTGASIYTSVSSPDSTKWITYTDDGYWDASPNGGELVAMVKEPPAKALDYRVWNVDQFAVKNNRPDLIAERMGAQPVIVEHFKKQYHKRLKKLGLTESNLADDYEVPEVQLTEARQDNKFLNLKFSFSDKKYALRRYNIYVNDVPLFGSYGKPLSGNAKELREKIELTDGANKIEVSCVNDKGTESFRAVTYANTSQPGKGNLYYIGFGVSKYRNSRLDLEYAHKDAKDLANIFSSMKGAFDEVFVHTFTDQDCTVRAIKKAKNLLKKAKPEDTLVLFIAGHGMHDTDQEATYYYVTHETDTRNLQKTAANFEIIEDILQGIAPRKKLFLMDTCESGEVEDEVSAQYLAMATSRGIKARAINKQRGIAVTAKSEEPKRTYLFEKDRYIFNDLVRRSGAVVFSSSRGGEFSYESDAIKNGFFTAELMRALRGDATVQEGTVSVDSLRIFVSKEVSKLTDGKQNPTVDRDNLYLKFAFPVVK